MLLRNRAITNASSRAVASFTPLASAIRVRWMSGAAAGPTTSRRARPGAVAPKPAVKATAAAQPTAPRAYVAMPAPAAGAVPKFQFNTNPSLRAAAQASAGAPSYYDQMASAKLGGAPSAAAAAGGGGEGGESTWEGSGSFGYRVLVTGGAVLIVSFAVWQFLLKEKSYAAPAAPAASATPATAAVVAVVKKPEVTKGLLEVTKVPAGASLSNMLLFSGRGNVPLAEDTARYLGVPLGKVDIRTFADGEIGIQVNENIRGKDCFILQSISKPVNDNLVELCLLISTMRRASAQTITAVIPYYGYARQDRKFTSRVPISAADTALMLSTLGVDRVIAVDLHSGQIQGFFRPRVPVTHMSSGFVGATFFAEKSLNRPVIVACDAGGVGRAKHFRDILAKQGHEDASLDIAMLIQKNQKKDIAGHLTGVQQAKLDLVGKVDDADCILIGDIIDSAATMVRAAEVLKVHGASRVYAFAPHGVFNGDAVERITASPLEEVVVTDTTPLPANAALAPKNRQLSIAPLLAESIRRVHRNESVSSLFAAAQPAAARAAKQAQAAPPAKGAAAPAEEETTDTESDG